MELVWESIFISLARITYPAVYLMAILVSIGMMGATLLFLIGRALRFVRQIKRTTLKKTPK